MQYRIMLVEDEADVRAFLLRVLERILPQATVITAANGVEALALLHQPVDLIVSDHRMPWMTGLDLLRIVRATSEVPFVLISADPAVEAAALAAGASAFLPKPLSVAQLRETLLRYLP